MTGIEKEQVQAGLCNCVDCKGFEPKLGYEVDLTAKTVKITDTSTFGSGDSLNVVNINIYDKTGKEKHGQITTGGGNRTVDVNGLDLSELTITATTVSTNGCKADSSIYKIGSTGLTGKLGVTNYQGERK